MLRIQSFLEKTSLDLNIILSSTLLYNLLSVETANHYCVFQVSFSQRRWLIAQNSLIDIDDFNK